MIKHVDGRNFSISITRNEIEDIKASSWGQPDAIDRRIREYLLELRRQDRKKKLEKIFSSHSEFLGT